MRAPEQIMAEYREARMRDDFNLRAFVTARFRLTPNDDATYRTIPGQDVRVHIDRLWSVLERSISRSRLMYAQATGVIFCFEPSRRWLPSMPRFAANGLRPL